MHHLEIYIYNFRIIQNTFTHLHTQVWTYIHTHPEFIAERQTRIHTNKDYPIWLPQNRESIGIGL